MSEEERYDEEEIQEMSEAYLNAKNKIFKKAIKIERTLVKDSNPYILPLGCKNFDVSGQMIDKTELSVNGEEGLDLLSEIKFLKGLIDSVDTYKRIKTEDDFLIGSKLMIGEKIVPFENTKLFRDIKYEALSFMEPSKVTGVEGYLDVDKIYPVVTKGTPIDYDKFSEKLYDETPSMQINENRCYVIFEKFLDTDKKIKVKSFFNPLCNQIGFFMFIGEPNPDKTSADKYVYDKICFRSFYKVINNKIVFRPYSNLKPPLPASRPRYVKKPMKNFIVEINKILGKEEFKITTTYDDLMKIIFRESVDIRDKLFNVLLPLNNDFNKALFKEVCGRIEKLYKSEFTITDKTNHYIVLAFLGTKQMAKVKDFYKSLIKKDIFEKKIETLKKKYLNYTDYFDEEKKLTIDKFETQVNPVLMGTPNLAMEDAITIKRFLKLDPIFELNKTKEVQFRLIDRNDIEKQEDIVFDARTYMEDITTMFNKKVDNLRKDVKPENLGQFEANMAKAKAKLISEEKAKFEKKYGEGNRKVYVKFEKELYETVPYAYFRPFTLSDIILARYRKISLFDHFGFSKEPKELLQSLNTLFLNIEELRSFVFTFVSLYYQLKTDISSKKARLDSAGRAINSAGTFIDQNNPEFVETGPNIKLNIYKIYPNQLYSKEDQRIRSAEKTFRYYSIYDRMIRTQNKKRQVFRKLIHYDYFLVKSKASDKDIPLRFLQLEEGIVGEAHRPEYIKPEELFVPELEIGLVERNVEMINKAFKKLTTIEPRIIEWSGPDEDDIPVGLQFKPSPDGSMAAVLRKYKDIPQPIKSFAKQAKQANLETKKGEDDEEGTDDDEEEDEGPEILVREKKEEDGDDGEGGDVDGDDGGGEDDNTSSGLIIFQKRVKDKRDNKPENATKKILEIFREHLEWLIKESSGREVFNKHTDKITTKKFIDRLPNGFNKKLAYEIDKYKDMFLQNLYSWKMAAKTQPLDTIKMQILKFYYWDGSNVTKYVVTAFLLYLQQSKITVDKDLAIDKIPDNLKAPNNNAQKSATRLVGDDFRVSLNIMQTIYDSLEKYKNNPSHTREFKVSPEYLEKADLFWTIRNTANQSILRNKIQGYVYIFKHLKTHTFEFPEENAIFESLYNADVERNIQGMKSLIEFLNSNKSIIVIKKHIPRKLGDEAEDKAARDETIRTNGLLVDEIIALRSLKKNFTGEHLSAIEEKTKLLKEEAKRIGQNIEAELLRINASGFGNKKLEKLESEAEQKRRAAAKKGDVEEVASKLAKLSSTPANPTEVFRASPAGQALMKRIRKLDDNKLKKRTDEAANAYKEAVSAANEAHPGFIVELEEARAESQPMMDDRVGMTEEEMKRKLKEADSLRIKLYKEYMALEPEKPDAEADRGTQEDYRRRLGVQRRALAVYEQAEEKYVKIIGQAVKYGIATVYKTASEILSDSNSEPNASELPSVLPSSEVSSELPSALSSEPATEVESRKPKAEKVLDKKALAKQFRSDFGNLVAALRELEVVEPFTPVTPPVAPVKPVAPVDTTKNQGIKLRVKSAYEKYLEIKKLFTEAEIEKLISGKKEDMKLIDAYEVSEAAKAANVKPGVNSEANKQKYMKYKLKYMKLKELLGTVKY